jgi:hypothetical protein
MKYPPRRPGGWLRAPVNKLFYRLANGTLSLLRNAPLVVCAAMVNEISKPEQCRMVARKFFRRTKILNEIFRRGLFGTRSTARVKYLGCNCNEHGAQLNANKSGAPECATGSCRDRNCAISGRVPRWRLHRHSCRTGPRSRAPARFAGPSRCATPGRCSGCWCR